jgi:glycosyltransferase involved in cell wall biosynthesis
VSESPLVSIILPTYNGSRYLQESIESCVRQTYAHWELIIVDDASTDKTDQIIAHWRNQDARIRSFRNETNRKLSASLNRGFAEANGDLLTWTSDDNRYRPNALATMVAFLDNHSEVGLVYSDYSKIDGQGKVLDQISVGEPQQLAVRNCVQGSFMYRRKVYELIGEYDEKFHLVEDWDYWIRILRSFKIAPLHENLYEFRTHAESLTKTRKTEVNQAVAQLLRHYLQKRWLFSRTTRTARARGYLKLQHLSFEDGHRTDANRYLLRALVLAPREAMRGRRTLLTSLLLGERATGLLFRCFRRTVAQDIAADCNGPSLMPKTSEERASN